MAEPPDVEDLLERIGAVEDALADLRRFGETHDIPVVERTARRMEGTLRTIRQNTPGGIVKDRDEPG